MTTGRVALIFMKTVYTTAIGSIFLSGVMLVTTGYELGEGRLLLKRKSEAITGGVGRIESDCSESKNMTSEE